MRLAENDDMIQALAADRPDQPFCQGETGAVGMSRMPMARNRRGITLSARTVKESIWQGTVGLVLKKGNTAFKDESETGTFFYGQGVKVGDSARVMPAASRSMASTAAWRKTR